jgi:hypothetical protein
VLVCAVLNTWPLLVCAVLNTYPMADDSDVVSLGAQDGVGPGENSALIGGGGQVVGEEPSAEEQAAYYTGPMSPPELWNLLGSSARETPVLEYGPWCLGGSGGLLELIAGCFAGQELFRNDVVSVLVAHQLGFVGAPDVISAAFSLTVQDVAELSDSAGPLADAGPDARQARMSGLVSVAMDQMSSSGKPVAASALTSSLARLVQGVLRVFLLCCSPPPPPEYRPRVEGGGDGGAASLVSQLCLGISQQMGGVLQRTLAGAGASSDVEGDKRSKYEKYAQGQYAIISERGWSQPADALRVTAATLYKLMEMVVIENTVPSVELSTHQALGVLPVNMIPMFPAAAGNHLMAGLGFEDDGVGEEYRQTVAASGAVHFAKHVSTLKFETPEQMAAAVERWVIAIWVVCCDLIDVPGRSAGLYDTGKTAGSTVVVYCPRAEVELWAAKIKDLAHLCSRRPMFSLEQNMSYFRMLVGTAMRTVSSRHNVEGPGRLTLGAALHVSREQLLGLIGSAQAALVLPYEDTYLAGAPGLGVAIGARVPSSVSAPAMMQQGAPQASMVYPGSPYTFVQPGWSKSKGRRGGGRQVCPCPSVSSARSAWCAGHARELSCH